MAVKKDLKAKTPGNIDRVKGGIQSAAQRRVAEYGSNQPTKPPGNNGKKTL